MLGNISGPTLIVILFIILLLFGAPKLPALARSLGQSMKILKKEVTTSDDEKAGGADAAGEGSAPAPAPAAPVTPPAPAAPAAPAAAPVDQSEELAKAKAEVEAARAEAEALRAAAEKRTASEGGNA